MDNNSADPAAAGLAGSIPGEDEFPQYDDQQPQASTSSAEAAASSASSVPTPALPAVALTPVIRRGRARSKYFSFSLFSILHFPASNLSLLLRDCRDFTFPLTSIECHWLGVARFHFACVT